MHVYVVTAEFLETLNQSILHLFLVLYVFFLIYIPGHLSYSRLRQFSTTSKVCKQKDSRKNEEGSQLQDQRLEK